MLIHIDENGWIVWYNNSLSKEMAAPHFDEQTVWIAEESLPQEIAVPYGQKAVLAYDVQKGLHYILQEDEAQQYSATQEIMQAIGDLELLLWEGGVIHV